MSSPESAGALAAATTTVLVLASSSDVSAEPVASGAGQHSRGPWSQAGPFHHRSCRRISVVALRVARSAGLSAVRTWRHRSDGRRC